MLQLGVLLYQLFDLLFEDLHFLPHGIHQVTLYQILKRRGDCALGKQRRARPGLAPSGSTIAEQWCGLSSARAEESIPLIATSAPLTPRGQPQGQHPFCAQARAGTGHHKRGKGGMVGSGVCVCV